MVFIPVAHIIGLHGLKGSFKVYSDLDSWPLIYKDAFIEDKGKKQFILNNRLLNNKKHNYVVEIEGINSMPIIFVKHTIFIKTEDLVKYRTSDDMVYVFELLGKEVKDMNGQMVGILEEVIFNGQDILNIRTIENTIISIPYTYVVEINGKNNLVIDTIYFKQEKNLNKSKLNKNGAE